MAFPRKDLFSIEDQAVSNYARALCHPVRSSIMRELQRHEGMYVHEIEHIIPLSMGAVSDHLAILREAQFVHVECQGRFNYYTINLRVLAEVDLKFNMLFAGLYGMGRSAKRMESERVRITPWI